MIRTRLALFEVLCKRSLGEGVLIERCPVLQTELLRGSIGTLLLHFLRPVVGLFDNLKLDSGVRIADLVQFDFDEEETDIFIRMVVQPFDSSTVFLSGAFNNPYYDISGVLIECSMRFIAEMRSIVKSVSNPVNAGPAKCSHCSEVISSS